MANKQQCIPKVSFPENALGGMKFEFDHSLIIDNVRQEIKKPPQFPPAPSEPQDCTIIDVEDYNSSSDLPVPMFVQHTEAMLEEIDRMVFEYNSILKSSFAQFSTITYWILLT